MKPEHCCYYDDSLLPSQLFCFCFTAAAAVAAAVPLLVDLLVQWRDLGILVATRLPATLNQLPLASARSYYEKDNARVEQVLGSTVLALPTLLELRRKQSPADL